MRICFLGKGGSGKTFFAAGLIEYLRQKPFPLILAIDADPNENLHSYLKLEKPKHMIGDNYQLILDYIFLNRNCQGHKPPKLGCLPPSIDSTFIDFDKKNFLIKNLFTLKNNLALGVVGSYTHREIGAWCYHGRLESLELFIHYLLDKEKDPVIIDMNPGVDILATSLYFSCQFYIFLVEPTLKSIQVYKDFCFLLPKEIKKNIALKVIINKIYQEKEKDFILKHINSEDIIGFVPFYHNFNDKKFMNEFIKKNNGLFKKILAETNKSHWNRHFYLKQLINHFLKKKTPEEGKKFTDNYFSYSKVL